MGFTLVEKNYWNPFHMQGQQCDFDCPVTEDADKSAAADVPLVPLITAIATLLGAILIGWSLAGAIFRTLRKPCRRPRSSLLASDDDREGQDTALKASQAGPYGSPTTPPPAAWLRDADTAAAAAGGSVPYMTPYFTPPPTEQLLFSVSPTRPQPHYQQQGGLASPGSMPYYPPVAVAGAGGGPGSPGRPSMRLPGAFSPGASGGGMRRGASGGMRRRTAGGGWGGGWARELLSRQSALLPAISSVEGLMASAEFQEHVRSTRRRSPTLEREQSQAKVQLYKDLRRMDPDAFRRLLTRSDIRSYSARPPPLPLLLVDYLMEALLLPAGMAALAASQRAAGSPLIMYGPLAAWLLLKLWLAASGHPSLLCRLAGVYLVYDNSRGGGNSGSREDGQQQDEQAEDEQEQPYGNAWESLAGMGAHISLALLEVSMAFASLGVLALGALGAMVAGRRRRTLAMWLLGLRLEQETSRPTTLSSYSPPSEAAATPLFNASSRVVYGLPERYR